MALYSNFGCSQGVADFFVVSFIITFEAARESFIAA